VRERKREREARTRERKSKNERDRDIERTREREREREREGGRERERESNRVCSTSNENITMETCVYERTPIHEIAARPTKKTHIRDQKKRPKQNL